MQRGQSAMNENTRFEEYERKTRKIILIIGIISGLFFLFGLLIISTEVKQYNPEENTPDGRVQSESYIR